MKTVIMLASALCLTLSVSLIGCAESGTTAGVDSITAITTASNRVEGSVAGMDCGGCTGSVCAAVEQVAGVTGAHADLATGKLVVAMEEGADTEAAKAEIDKAISALSNGKFTVSDLTSVTETTTEEAAPADESATEEPADESAGLQADPGYYVASYKVNGMTCKGCSFEVSDVLVDVNGIEDAEACHKSGSIQVMIADGQTVSSDLIAKALTDTDEKYVLVTE